MYNSTWETARTNAHLVLLGQRLSLEKEVGVLRASIVLLGLALAALALASDGLTLSGGATTTEADGANVMSVDAVSGGPIDASRVVTSSDPFDVDIYIQHGGSSSFDYSAYEAVLCFDSSILDFVPAADLDGDTTAESWTYTDLGGMRGHVGVMETGGGCPAGYPDTRLYGASIRYVGTTNASGVGATAAFRCVASGTTTVRLVAEADDGFFSTTLGRAGGSPEPLPTTLADAEIICSPPPTPTACPAEVCTPTATPSPAPTPTATPTPDPSAQPNLISVDAVSGGSVQATGRFPVGSEFDVDINIQHGGSSSFDYAGYEAALCFDSHVLDFLPAQDMTGDTVPESWTYTDLGDMFLRATNSEWTEGCPAALPDTFLVGGAGRSAGTTSASGASATARFACVTPGVTTLHLVMPGEALLYSDTFATGGIPLPTELADATVTCLPDTDGDKCADFAEFRMHFQPVDPADFYSVPVPARPDADPNGPKNEVVTMQDVLAVLLYVGTHEGDSGSPNPNGVAYDAVKGSCPGPFAGGFAQREGLCYDRSPSAAPNPPWEAGPPNGAVNMSDVLAVLAQVGLDCGNPP
jgi:hypothetical protein